MAPVAVDTTQQQPLSVNDIAPKKLQYLPNRAFVLRETKCFVYEERPVPDLPSNKHVIVAIKATGLCGSDVCTPHRHRVYTFADMSCTDSLLATWRDWSVQGEPAARPRT